MVPSTTGSNPTLQWVSRPFSTRDDAARFEASMKSRRDQGAERSREIVGHDNLPFDGGPVSYQNRSDAYVPESGVGSWTVVACLAVAAFIVVLFIAWTIPPPGKWYVCSRIALFNMAYRANHHAPR